MVHLQKEIKLTEKIVRDLSSQLHEPVWLLDKRLEAFRIFESSPLPALQAGLGVTVSPVDFTTFGPEPAPTLSLPSGVEALSFTDSPASLRTQLFRLIDPRDKLSALSAAFFTSGLYIRVPAGMQCTEPLLIHSSPIQRIVLLVEAGASVTLIETVPSPFSSVAAEIIVEDNAQLHYATSPFFNFHSRQLPVWQVPATNTPWLKKAEPKKVNTPGGRAKGTIAFPAGRTIAAHGDDPGTQQAHSLAIRRATVGRDASLSWFHTEHGNVHAETSTLLTGEGARTALTGLFFGNGSFDLRANAFHRAPHTTSDMLFKGALTGGRALVRGLVNIHQQAPYSNGYQKGEILLLNPGCEAAVIPDLEIDNNNVRCTHGATVSRPDAEKLFYLQSRGLPPAAALNSPLSSLFESALSRAPTSLHPTLRFQEGL